MIVTGVSSAGSKGVNSVQVAAVDTKESARLGRGGDKDGEHNISAKSGEPQPVVFPRKGVPLDQRPVAMRQEQAAHRYKHDGGNRKHS